MTLRDVRGHSVSKQKSDVGDLGFQKLHWLCCSSLRGQSGAATPSHRWEDCGRDRESSSPRPAEPTACPAAALALSSATAWWLLHPVPTG